MADISSSRPSVVVLGGGYGGIDAASALDDVADVTLVDPKDSFVHNVAAWRALVEPEWLDRIFLPYERLLTNGRFRRDSAVSVDGRVVTLASGARLEPDHLILATGSSYPFPAKSEDADSETARARYRQAHEVVRAARQVLVIGAGPAGLELAGEIKAAFPHIAVTIADVAPDILEGPYDQALRDELRRQLKELGVELRLGSALRELPAVPPATAAAIAVETQEGETLTADVWFRAFGLTVHTEYLRGELADTLDGAGYLRVGPDLGVIGQDRVYAIGDITDADRNMAAIAGAQAAVVAANIRRAITGEGEPAVYTRFPPVLAVPLGPERGAGQLPGHDGVAGPDVIAAVKGRAMVIDRYEAMFNQVIPTA